MDRLPATSSEPAAVWPAGTPAKRREAAVAERPLAFGAFVVVVAPPNAFEAAETAQAASGTSSTMKQRNGVAEER